jgi:hypothetical protein
MLKISRPAQEYDYNHPMLMISRPAQEYDYNHPMLMISRPAQEYDYKYSMLKISRPTQEYYHNYPMLKISRPAQEYDYNYPMLQYCKPFLLYLFFYLFQISDSEYRSSPANYRAVQRGVYCILRCSRNLSQVISHLTSLNLIFSVEYGKTRSVTQFLHICEVKGDKTSSMETCMKNTGLAKT